MSGTVTNSGGTLNFSGVTFTNIYNGNGNPDYTQTIAQSDGNNATVNQNVSAVGQLVSTSEGALYYDGYAYSTNGKYLVYAFSTAKSASATTYWFTDGTITQTYPYFYPSVTQGIPSSPCFLTGTRIATPEGGVAVEDLHEDDLVLTASGEAVPVRWIGHRHVVAAELPDAHLYAPVVIEAGAIAPGKPARDLWVTPDHAIFVEGRLIPAKLLVNGTTIRQETRAEYSFYHLELDRHSLLLAEGLEAESYLDIEASRQRFDNHAVTDMALDLSLTELTEQAYAERGCYPLTLRPDAVKPVWEAVASRGGAALAAKDFTTDPALHLLVAGVAVQPSLIEDGRYLFSLPANAGKVVIASRAASPWASQPWLDDRRELGVAIGSAMIRDGDSFMPVDLAGPAAVGGWYGQERDESGRSWRWTDGAAALALPEGTGKRWLVLTVMGTMAYPVKAPAARDDGEWMALAG
jgi:hypothetical protein